MLCATPRARPTSEAAGTRLTPARLALALAPLSLSLALASPPARSRSRSLSLSLAPRYFFFAPIGPWIKIGDFYRHLFFWTICVFHCKSINEKVENDPPPPSLRQFREGPPPC